MTGSTFFTKRTLTCNTYLSGFRVHNSEGLVNYLKAEVSCPALTSTLTHTFTATENNTVAEICYTTVVFCEECTNITYLDWGRTGEDWVDQNTNPTSITVLNRY